MPDRITLPFIFVPDGTPMPDIHRIFRDPIILRARFERESLPSPAPPIPSASVTMLPGAFAPIPIRRSATTHANPPAQADNIFHPTDRPMLILSTTGAVLAEGTAVALSAQALRLALTLTKPHPAFLVAAGGVLAFATLAALAEHLAHMTGDRNAGLPGPLRARSERARASSNATDRDVTDRLDPDEWSAHHFIGIHAAQQHTALLEVAARAGWHMDAPENVIALPRTRAAQTKLARAGIHRPLHDNGHPQWNDEVTAELRRITDQLNGLHLPTNSEAYALRARSLLEILQAVRRQKAMLMDRIVRNEITPSPTSRQL